ncbi:MAG: hypothetical protein HDR44_01330 [Allobaculum sp.]|nr:hypothetical protein [Allobaculum sp.]
MNIPTKQLLSGLLVAGFVFTGCSSNEDKTSSSQASSSISTVVKENLVFGTPTSQALRVVFTNNTGLDIDSIKLVPIESDENVTSPELMPTKGQWKSGEQADLYVQSGDKSIGMSLEIQAKKDGETLTYTMPVFPTAALFDAAMVIQDSRTSSTSSTSSTASSTSSASNTSSTTSSQSSTLSLQSILKIEDDELVMTWRQDGQTMSSQDYEAPVPVEEEIAVDETIEESEEPQTQEPVQTTPTVETPTSTQPVVETPTVQEPTYVEDDYYYDEPIYIPPTSDVSTTTPSSPAVDPTYGTPIVNPTEAPSTPTSSGGTTTTTPSVPDQGGENCVNPGDLILNSESHLAA